MNICNKCGQEYELNEGCVPTMFCDLCAQTILERIIEITPQPPREITWERGRQILNTVQKEIWESNRLRVIP